MPSHLTEIISFSKGLDQAKNLDKSGFHFKMGEFSGINQRSKHRYEKRQLQEIGISINFISIIEMKCRNEDEHHCKIDLFDIMQKVLFPINPRVGY